MGVIHNAFEIALFDVYLTLSILPNTYNTAEESDTSTKKAYKM